jgi:SWI/SNF-related matrix-associated actin-dependent regulator of chromatin subfamily A containing DEAD/H box 1
MALLTFFIGSQAERAEIADRILDERDQINVVVSTYEFAAKPEDNKFMRRLKPEVTNLKPSCPSVINID